MLVDQATNLLSEKLQSKYEALKVYLKNLESVIIAFSGGIDSTLVAYVAFQELNPRVLAVTSASESLKRTDLKLTQDLAKQWGMSHQIINTKELLNPCYSANPKNRCYYCKSTLYSELSKIAKTGDYKAIVNGTNIDDFQDFRPGLMAGKEYGVFTPLADCEFTKQNIRDLSAFLKLDNALKPQAACLASRIPYNTSITKELLERVERAEQILIDFGFSQCRVRHHNEIARLEIPPNEFDLALKNHQTLEKRIKECGYKYVTLDLGGYRTGSLNL